MAKGKEAIHRRVAQPTPILPLNPAADRADVAKKKNIMELERISNYKENSRLVLLTKNPQPILQSLGSEGDAVVSF